MHLGACLPATLLALLLLPFSYAEQFPLEQSPSASSLTLVDALGNDPDYDSLIKLLQRAKLIPTLNRLNGSTLFAPTNSAIKRYASTNPSWRVDNDTTLTDNIQEELRQQLFYHLLNNSISTADVGDVPLVNKTLLFPRTPLKPPSHEPPPHPPWMPVPGGTLGGEPQLIRLSKRDDSIRVGVDAFGKGGVKVVKDLQDAGNGVLLGISDVITTPPDLVQVVSQQPLTSYFYKILTPAIKKMLRSTPALTLFLPIDTAWEALDHYERLYLESEFATDDLTRIFNMHAVVENRVRYTDSFEPLSNVKTINGTNLEIKVSSKKTTVSGATLVHPDIYASNGVLHLVSSLLFPPELLKLTPEKYLLALNCTSFVSLLHSVGLTSLINDTSSKYTILAPQDDVLSFFGGAELPERGSAELKKLLQYHFIPGKWSPSDLKNGMLLETALEEEGLDGGKQVLGIEVGSEHNNQPDLKTIRFGGAGIIGDPVKTNNTNTIIYFLSRPLVPPADSLQTILPFLELSSFIAAVFSTSQAETFKKTPRTSLLIPQNIAFKRLGLLVSAHLLAPSSKRDLENVLLHHALDSVEYASSLQNGSLHSFATLEGSDIKADRLKNGTVYISSSGGWAGMRAELYPRDILTQTGVVHELSDILIPRSVELTVGKLMKAAKGSTMATLINKAGFDWVLNGTIPPDDPNLANLADKTLSPGGWTLLCPTDDAFKEYNLTELYANADVLKGIVTQHLIPPPSTIPSLIEENETLNNNRPLDMDNAGAFNTLRSPTSSYGDVVFRQNAEDKEYLVGIKGGRGKDGNANWARVISWGRSTTGGGTGGVIQIDRVLMPYQPPWWIEYGAPSAVCVVGVVLICLFFYGVRILWQRDTTEATYEPVGGFGRDDDP